MELIEPKNMLLNVHGRNNMSDIKCQCDKCSGVLHLIPEAEVKGRKNVFVCDRCGCTYGFIVVLRTVKCCGKTSGKHKRPKDPTKILQKSIERNKEVLETLGTKKRRGRPKKIFIEGPEGEKLDVSVDNPKLKKLAETSVLSTTPFGEGTPIKRKRGRPRKIKTISNQIEHAINPAHDIPHLRD